MRDQAAAELCAALLAAAPPDGCKHTSPLRVLHLGGTGAGNATAVACAEALTEKSSCRLSVLCLSGEVGDVGAHALAATLTEGCSLRELYLLTWSLEAAEQFWEANPRRSDIIFTLTTTPTRILTIDTLIISLLLQDMACARVRLNIPLLYREKDEYAIPPRLAALKSVQIVRTEHDWGPGTKFIPSVVDFASKGATYQRLLIVDDDVVYPADFIRTFHHFGLEFPFAALGSRGWDVPRSLRWADSGTVFGRTMALNGPPSQIDIITGCGAVLVKPFFFHMTKLVDFAAAPRAAFFVDDIWVR